MEEFTSRMTRFLASVSVLLFAGSFVIAQSPTPVPNTLQSAATSTDNPDIHEFQKIEDSWSLAVNQHNQYGLELVLSPLLVDVSAEGDVTTRDQQVVKTITNDDKAFYLTQKVITVRMLGDVAVVNGTYTLRHRVNTAEVEDHGIFTHVFQRLRGGWMCVNAQRTLIREDSNAKSRNKKPSTAEMPFHIPFFMKSDKGSQ